MDSQHLKKKQDQCSVMQVDGSMSNERDLVGFMRKRASSLSIQEVNMPKLDSAWSQVRAGPLMGSHTC